MLKFTKDCQGRRPSAPSKLADTATRLLHQFITSINRNVVLDVTLWGYLEHYLYYELQEEVTSGRVRDERRAGQLMLDHTTVVSAKLCFLLLTFTSQVKWELCAYRVDSIDQLRKEIIDLTG